MAMHPLVDSIAYSVFVVILVEFDKYSGSETSRLVYTVAQFAQNYFLNGCAMC